MYATQPLFGQILAKLLGPWKTIPWANIIIVRGLTGLGKNVRINFMKPLKLSIRFGDNDFCNTFLPLLRELGEAYRSNRIEYTLEQYVEIINNLSLGFYLLHQNHFEYNTGKEDISRVQEYLKISVEHLSFENYSNWNNSETFNLYCDDYDLTIYSN